MPTDPNPLENLVEETLFAIEQELVKRGLPQMNDETLAEAHQRLNHPEVLRHLQEKRLTPSLIADHVSEAIRVMQNPPQPLLMRSASLPGTDPDTIGLPQGQPEPEPGNPEPDPLQGRSIPPPGVG